MAIASTIRIVANNITDNRWVDIEAPTPTEIETTITEIKVGVDAAHVLNYFGASSSAISWGEKNEITGLYSINLKFFGCTMSGAVPEADVMATLKASITTVFAGLTHVDFGGMVCSKTVYDNRSMSGSPA